MFLGPFQLEFPMDERLPEESYPLRLGLERLELELRRIKQRRESSFSRGSTGFPLDSFLIISRLLDVRSIHLLSFSKVSFKELIEF
jgi:hypothetical protein